MLRLTSTLGLLWVAMMMGLSSYLDFSVSKIASHFRKNSSEQVWQRQRQSDIIAQPGINTQPGMMAKPAANDSSGRSRRAIDPASPIGEPEDYARVGLNEYYRDLDRCLIPIWTPDMDLLPVWEYECLKVLMDTPIDVEGNRLIHAAARSANYQALAVLADLGVRIDCPNYAGRTPRDVLKCFDDIHRSAMLARLDGTKVPVPGVTTQQGGMVATRPEPAAQGQRTEL